MKIYTPLWYLILGTCFFLISLSSNSQSFSHPSTGTVITGDIMHAYDGSNFIGVVYSRSGSVYYNQVNSEGAWGEEALLGTGNAARLSIDSNDRPHVVYTTTSTPTKIAYLKYEGSNWSEVEYIESLNNGGAGNCSKPDIAIAINGDIHITYTDSHGSTGDDYIHPDIMYAKKTTGNFNIQLIFRGYRDYSSSGSWGADYFSKGSYIAVNESGDYFIIAHRQNIWRWSFGTDNTYFIMISSNLGSGNMSNYGTDIFTIHDLNFNGTSVLALYKQTTFKTSELTVGSTTISFSNTQDVSTVTSVSSVAGNSTDLAVVGKNNTNLFTQFNGLGYVYTDVVVKNTIVSVVEVDGVFYAVYTDNGDSKIKIREIAEPLSITRFEVPGQDGPTVIDGQAGTVDIIVEGGTDLTNLVATYSTTSDVTGATVETVQQTSAGTANDFSLPLTYVLSDGVKSRDWLVSVSVGILDTIEVDICDGETYLFGSQEYSETGNFTETFTAANGSDSTVLLILTVKPVYNHTDVVNICQGESFTFGTQTLTTVGEYTEMFKSAAGCDSTVLLTLHVNPVYNHSDEVILCHGQTYVFGSQSLTAAGEYTEVFTSAFGCDSTVVLNLTVNPVFNHTDEVEICQGESYVFGTQILTISGEFTEIFESETGCDSTVTLTLTVNPVYNHTDEVAICQGETYVFGTQHLTMAGEYTEVFESSSGCDSTVILTLHVNPVFNHSDEAAICEGETYIFGSQSLIAIGEYTEVFNSVSGCDSTVVLSLTVNPVYNHYVTAEICQGETYEFGSQSLTTTGEYTEVFNSVSGCDSAVVLSLSVNPLYSHSAVKENCQGETYVFGSQFLTTAGEYTEVFESVSGCDSTVTLTLIINPVYYETDEATICQGETYIFGTQNLTIAGEYTDVFKSLSGCDSTVTLTLYVNPVFNHTETATICQGEQFVFGTQNLTVSGEYTEIFETTSGCDSTVVLHLTVNPEYNHTVQKVICNGESYMFGTQALTASGVYTEVFKSITGCDSTVVLTLTVSPLYNHTDEVTICQGETYIFGTQSLTTAGEYTEVFKSISGCDSTVTLTLYVNPVYNDTNEAVICQGDDFIFGIQTLTVSGIYTEVFESITGCDSTVVLTLNVNPVYNHTDETVICQGESYVFGTQNLTVTGEYTEVFESITGCDSTIVLALTVYPVYALTTTSTVYSDELPFTFGTRLLTEEGTFTESFQSVNGCDSIVTLTLVIKPADLTPPILVTNPIQIRLNSNGQYNLKKTDIRQLTTGTTDNETDYDDLTFEVVPHSFSCEMAGTTVAVTITATDLKGNSSTTNSSVKVIDQTPPEIVCRNIELWLDENGLAELNVADIYSSLHDACGIFSVSAEKTSFNSSDLGNQDILVTATDNNNNKNTCTASITITDLIPPQFSPVGNLVVTPEAGSCETTIEYPAIHVTDNCMVKDLKLIKGAGPGAVLPVGNSIERWIAIDDSGNSDTLSFEIKVVNNHAAPGINKISDIEMPEDTQDFSLKLSNVKDGSLCDDYSLDFSMKFEKPDVIQSYRFNFNSGEDSALLILNPAQDAFGETSAIMTVTNSETKKQYSDTFNIYVTPVNDPPIAINTYMGHEINTNEVWKSYFSPISGVLFDDLEDELLQLSITSAESDSLPKWISFKNDTLIAVPAAENAGCTTLKITATDSAGEKTDARFNLCVTIPVGLNSFFSNDVKIYPNPTSGKLYIDFSQQRNHNTDVSIINSLGKEVYSHNITNEKLLEIDLSHHTSGIYILKAAGEEFCITHKILLKATN